MLGDGLLELLEFSCLMEAVMLSDRPLKIIMSNNRSITTNMELIDFNLIFIIRKFSYLFGP